MWLTAMSQVTAYIHKIKVSCVADKLAEKNNVEEKWNWSLKKK